MKHVFERSNPQAKELLVSALAAAPPRLDRAALAIAMIGYPKLDLEKIELQLEQLSARVAAKITDHNDGLARLEALRGVLATEEGFHGNSDNYDQVDNNFLNRVLERKLGLPITLSVLYIEVGRRVGIPIYGISFPGHFLVATEIDGHRIVMDPFAGGRYMTLEDCEAQLRRISPQLRFSPKLLSAASPSTIVYRMLSNLKRQYIESTDGEQALRAIDMLLVLAPDNPGELRARAAILSALGAYRAALADLEKCLKLAPRAPDHANLEMAAKALRQRVEYLN